MIAEQISHYRIVSKLGAGGMGEVYLAEDTRLSRRVALKLLPAEFTRDPARVRRFVQEAKAASALNHPNILTIHEISEANGTQFITTEFIEGRTLRQCLSDSGMSLNTTLDLATQIAAALVAAHEADIVHRDLKPENVMLRRDGIVKVLDFGLAKLAEASPLEQGSETQTLAKANTDPGTVVGTASYMSPEQARGQEVDSRSDIFSFGVILYEMIAHRPPFAGVNAIDVMGAILNREPAPLNTQAAEIPAELRRIVTKMLRKERDERYQSSKELLLDLKSLKQERDLETKLKGRQEPSIPALAGTGPVGELPDEGGTTNVQQFKTPPEAATRRTTSSAEYLVSEIKRHKTGALIGLVALVAFVCLLAYGIYRFAGPRQTPARFQNVKFTQLTNLGQAGQGASISPDGKLICYAKTEGSKLSLWTKAIATGSEVQLVAPIEVAELGSTTFSPNGNFVCYVVQEKGGQTALYQIPALGGTPKKILTNIRGSVGFSPDGKQIAFMRRRDPDTGNFGSLIIANADGSNDRVLVKSTNVLLLGQGPSWSPDGRLIAFGAFLKDKIAAALMAAVVNSGEVKPLALGATLGSCRSGSVVQKRRRIGVFSS
jgi:serine/threonine protein kinase